MVARVPVLAVREAAVIVWWRRTPVEGGETGTGGGGMGCWEDMTRVFLFQGGKRTPLGSERFAPLAT